MPKAGLPCLGQGSQIRTRSGGGRAGSRHRVPKTETKVVRGRDTWWKVLEGAWVVGTRGLEFWCCMECNSPLNHLVLDFVTWNRGWVKEWRSRCIPDRRCRGGLVAREGIEVVLLVRDGEAKRA